MKWKLLLFAALVAAIGAEAAVPALRSHEVGAEMAQVRAYMRAGEYRSALAFAAHVAGEHRGTPEAAALYAWLLRVGGQEAAARRLFDEARLRLPDEPPMALDATPARLPEGARIAGSGVLIDAGKRALLPLAAVEGAAQVWVRNGLGHLSRARIQRLAPAEGLAVAALDSALPFDAELEVSARAPFPGSVGFAVGHPVSSGAQPGWPLLASGFLGRPVGATAMRDLGGSLSAGGRGGAVFDAEGRLLGIAIPLGEGTAHLVTASQIPEAAANSPAPGPRSASMPVDRIYEGALRTALQVICTR